MPTLKDTIAAIVSDVARGRVHADIASAEVAVLYKEHPILREFPLPYMTIDKVEIDLKVALQPRETGTSTGGTSAVEAHLAQQHEKLVAILQNVPALLKRYDLAVGTVGRKWPAVQRELSDHLREYLHASAHLPSAVKVAEVSCRIQRRVHELIATDVATTEVVRVRPGNLEAADREITLAVEPVLNVAPAPEEIDAASLDVLLSPEELKGIDINRLTSIHLTLVENDKRLLPVTVVPAQTGAQNAR
jgi:hypothetical protein